MELGATGAGGRTAKRRRQGSRHAEGSTRGLRVFCPWAACQGVTTVMVPQDLVSEDYKKRQVYCSGCMARFTLSVARCAGCHADVPLCRGHDWSVDKARDGLPPGRRPGQWKQQPRGKQLALQDVGICRGPGGAGGKVGRGDDPIEDCRTQQPEVQRAEMNKVCCYRYACRACGRDTTIRVLHRDEQGASGLSDAGCAERPGGLSTRGA